MITEQENDIFAIGMDNINMLKKILANGVDPNTRDNWNLSPLHYAVRSSCLAMPRVLLANGADPNARSNYGNTPLHCALCWKNKEMILELRLPILTQYWKYFSIHLLKT